MAVRTFCACQWLPNLTPLRLDKKRNYCRKYSIVSKRNPGLPTKTWYSYNYKICQDKSVASGGFLARLRLETRQSRHTAKRVETVYYSALQFIMSYFRHKVTTFWALYYRIYFCYHSMMGSGTMIMSLFSSKPSRKTAVKPKTKNSIHLSGVKVFV